MYVWKYDDVSILCIDGSTFPMLFDGSIFSIVSLSLFPTTVYNSSSSVIGILTEIRG